MPYHNPILPHPTQGARLRPLFSKRHIAYCAASADSLGSEVGDFPAYFAPERALGIAATRSIPVTAMGKRLEKAAVRRPIQVIRCLENRGGELVNARLWVKRNRTAHSRSELGSQVVLVAKQTDKTCRRQCGSLITDQEDPEESLPTPAILCLEESHGQKWRGSQ